MEVTPPDRIGLLVAEMDADQVQQVEQAGHSVFQKAGVLTMRCINVLLLKEVVKLNKENKLNLREK